MGYNISEVTGAGGGVSDWTFTLDVSQPTVTTVSGDFDVVPLIGGGGPSEATNGYTFSALDQPQFGTLVGNSVDGTFTFTADRAAVIATGSDQTVSFTVLGRSGGSSDLDTVTITIVICVARGTRIETPSGQIAVEDLAVGDRVCTHDGPAAAVRWIGRRRLGAVALAANPALRPVRIRAGALGDGLPQRDLVVSPQHRVLLRDWRAELLFGSAEVLVPAKALLDDGRVTVEAAAQEVEYFHLLFDRHELIYTEGAVTESFHPGAQALREMDAEVHEELLTLFPELEHGAGRWASARPSLKPWEARLLADRAAAPAQVRRAA